MRANIEVFPTAEALMTAAADAFVAAADTAIRATGRFAVALSGGSTPNGLHTHLAVEPHASRVPWPAVHVFWGDERCVSPQQIASNFRLAREALLDRVPIPRANVHRISGEDDPSEAAARYEAELRASFVTPAGAPRSVPGARFDLVLLGLGTDGHTASLFPGMQAVRETTKWVMAEYIEAVHMSRVTLTPVILNEAAEVVFLVSGGDKSAILRRVVRGSHEPDALPAQAITPRSGQVRWLVDTAAAADLAER